MCCSPVHLGLMRQQAVPPHLQCSWAFIPCRKQSPFPNTGMASPSAVQAQQKQLMSESLEEPVLCKSLLFSSHQEQCEPGSLSMSVSCVTYTSHDPPRQESTAPPPARVISLLVLSVTSSIKGESMSLAVWIHSSDLNASYRIILLTP